MDTSDKNRFSFRSRAQRLLSSFHDMVAKFLFKTVCEDICGLQIIKVRHIAFSRLPGESMADLENLLWVMKKEFAHTLPALLSLLCWGEFRQVHDTTPPDFSGVSHIDNSQDWGVVRTYASVKDFYKLVRMQESALDSCKCWETQKTWISRAQKCSKRKIFSDPVCRHQPHQLPILKPLLQKGNKEKHDLIFQLCPLWSKATWYLGNPLTNCMWLWEVTAHEVSTGKKNILVLPLPLHFSCPQEGKRQGPQVQKIWSCLRRECRVQAYMEKQIRKPEDLQKSQKESKKKTVLIHSTCLLHFMISRTFLIMDLH